MTRTHGWLSALMVLGFVSCAHRPAVTCRAGREKAGQERKSFSDEADRICRAVAEASEGAPRDADLVYYVGHGTVRPSGELALLPDGADAPSRSAADLMPAGSAARAVIINACDSGYADARSGGPAGPPTAMIGSGYGWVTALPRDTGRAGGQARAQLTAFGHWVEVALSGAADDPPIGNCDGAVTDVELVSFVNTSLRDTQDDDESPRAYMPFAVLKRDAQRPVVLLKLARARPCAAERVRVLRALGARADLPAELRAIAAWRAASGNGPSPRLASGYLLVQTRPAPTGLGGAATAARDFVDATKDTGNDQPWRAVHFDAADADTLARQLAIYVDDVELRILRISDSVSPTRVFADLIDPREGNTLLTRELALPADAGLAQMIPRRIDLVDLPVAFDSGADRAPVVGRWRDVAGCPTGKRPQPQLLIEVHGAVPATPVRLVPSDQAQGGAVVELPPLTGAQVTPVPCAAPVGQCFMVPNPGCVRRPPAQWKVEVMQ